MPLAEPNHDPIAATCKHTASSRCRSPLFFMKNGGSELHRHVVVLGLCWQLIYLTTIQGIHNIEHDIADLYIAFAGDIS